MTRSTAKPTTTPSDVSGAGLTTQRPVGIRIFTGRLHRVRGARGAVTFAEMPPPPLPEPVRRPAQVARTLALAHHLVTAIEQYEYRDRAELARAVGLTRARITQIMDLTLLASDIQEAVLEMEAVDGLEPMSVRTLQAIARAETWTEQRAAWRRLHV